MFSPRSLRTAPRLAGRVASAAARPSRAPTAFATADSQTRSPALVAATRLANIRMVRSQTADTHKICLLTLGPALAPPSIAFLPTARARVSSNDPPLVAFLPFLQ